MRTCKPRYAPAAEHGALPLSQLPEDEGVALLIQVVRTSRNATEGQRAMFWLGQSQDPPALLQEGSVGLENE
jgi:hypothetical protein